MGVRHAETLFSEFSQWGYDVRGWASKTRSEYLYRIRKADSFVRGVGPRSLFSATRDDLRAFQFSLPASAWSRNLARQALVGFYDFLIDKGWREDNPAKDLPILQVPETLPKPIEPEAVSAVLRASKVFGPMVECLIHLYAYTGLRRDEVRCLGWAAWDEGSYLSVYITKQRKDRKLFLHPEAEGALRRWRAKTDNAELVFPSPRNPRRPISDTWVATVVRDVGSMAGVEGLHPHVFRHSLATTAIETQHIKVVQKMLGHRTIAATERYILVRDRQTDEAFASTPY